MAVVKACCIEKLQEIEQLKLELAKLDKKNKLLRKKAAECYHFHSPATPRTKLSKSPAEQAITTKIARAKAQAKQPKDQA